MWSREKRIMMLENRFKLYQVIDEEGHPVREMERPSDTVLWKMYEGMLMVRTIDERMVKLQRQGRIAFYGTALGQEAAIVGSGLALKEGDWVFPALREVGVALLRGYKLIDLVNQLMGNCDDLLKGRQMPCHYSDRRVNHVAWSSCIGNQIPQAVGTALAMKYSQKDDIVVAYMGDGATSQGDFHVALNFAGVFSARVVFFCQNNQWAISVPFPKQTASKTIAQKAVAYGIRSVRVDGNDVLAVYDLCRRVFKETREGKGPVLIEALTYRLHAHSTSDDPSKYRDESEVEQWRKKDPLLRFEKYLKNEGIWNADRVQSLKENIQNEVMEAIAHAETVPGPELSTMFEDVYKDMPWHIREQYEELLHVKNWIEKHGLS